MTALFVGHTASHALLGLSPWLLPVIALAAKQAVDRTREAWRGGRGRERGRKASEVKPARRAAGAPSVMDERFRERVAAIIWPE